MFLPPEDRRPGYPPRPADGLSKRAEAVLLGLVAVFLLAVLLAPIGGSTVWQAVLSVLSAHASP